jgi:hypothetical protein
MKKKWFKIAVIGATIGITSGQASAIDLSGLASVIGIGDGLSAALCPLTPNAADPSAPGTPEAGNFFCQLKNWTSVANSAKDTYEKTQKIVDGLTPWKLATIGATIVSQPNGFQKVTEAFDKIKNSKDPKAAAAAAGEASTLLENLASGKLRTEKTDIEQKVEAIQKTIEGIQNPKSGGNPLITASAALAAFKATPSGQNLVAAGKSYGTAITETKSILAGLAAENGKAEIANQTFIKSGALVAEETSVNGENAAKSVKTAGEAEKKWIQASNNAVSTRAAIQVTNQILANAMTLQSDQFANLTSILQKQATLEAMTMQQMGTMISSELNKANQENASAEANLDEIIRNSQVSSELFASQLAGALEELPKTETSVSTTPVVISSSTLPTPTTVPTL